MRFHRNRVVVFHPGPFPHTIDYPTGRPALVFRDLGVDVHIVELADTGEPGGRDFDGTTRWTETSRRRALQRVAKLRPQLLLVDSATWQLAALPFARHTWVRAVGHSASSLPASAERLLIRAASYVSFVSPAEATWWGLSGPRVVPLPYPVDVAFWSARVAPGDTLWRSRGIEPPKGDVICYAAQLMPRKGQVELVRWLAPVLRERPSVRLVLAGGTVDPDTEDTVRADAEQLGIATQVCLIGQLDREALRELYAWSTLQVINSSAETQCMALYESLAAGTATLISDLPVMTSAFPHLPVHRNAEELQANVVRHLDHPGRRAALVEQARERVWWADYSRHDETCRSVATEVLRTTPAAVRK